jgi:hypothetical protein
MANTLRRLTGVDEDDPDRACILRVLTDAARRGEHVADPEVIARCVIEGRHLAARERQRESKGTVYYLRIGQFVKIGTALNLASRLFSYPPDAELLATEPGGRALEAVRHEQFGHLRAARREWYRPDPQLLEHCDTLARATT